MKKILRFTIILIILLVITIPVPSQIVIILRKSFIDSIKNTIIYNADFKVVKAHKYANPASKDGDMHIAGIENRIGLPVIAEIMNAKGEKEAVDFIHSIEGEDVFIPLKGVWRIWCEHTGHDEQEQGADFPEIKNSNPSHVFEIHPVTEVQEINVMNSLKKTVGYKYKETYAAFRKYSNLSCELTDLGDKVKIETKGIGYNYVDLSIELKSDQTIVEDGRFIYCDVFNIKKELIATNIRMVFPKGSDAEEKVKLLTTGDKMHVIGIPRINLDLVSSRINQAKENPGILEWNLPYEIIIVGNF